MYNISVKKNKNFCGNCGKYGHIYNKCTEPIISVGLITVKITDTNITNNIIDLYKEHTYDLDGVKNIITPINNNINSDIDSFCKYKNMVKFLLIRRKNSLGYMEFIRGKYDINNIDGIISLFEQMMIAEIDDIKKNDFKTLWESLWSDKTNNYYKYDYRRAEDKFNKLKHGNMTVGLYFYTNNVRPKYNMPEWGFPKGRRNHHEKNFECAKREFMEESGYTDSEYVVLEKLHSLNEVFIGTNQIQYKHIYYTGIVTSDDEPYINENNSLQCNEIGDIGWFIYDDAIQLLREHHTARKILLTQVYMFMINEVIKIHKTLYSNINYSNK